MGFGYIDLDPDNRIYYYIPANCSAVHRITGCLRLEGSPHPTWIFIQIDEIPPRAFYSKFTLCSPICSFVATFLTVTFWYFTVVCGDLKGCFWKLSYGLYHVNLNPELTGNNMFSFL